MYREAPSRLAGAVLWSHTSTDGGAGRVLPDGCTDLLWWGGALVVAGPDTRAHVHPRHPGEHVAGLRFAPGTGPLVFGVPAHELRDRRVPLGDLWPERAVRLLEEQVAPRADPGRALERVAAERLRAAPSVPRMHGQAVAALAQGRAVREVAEAAGLSERQLHRRCLDTFGYGPKTLARVLRMQRALAAARRPVPLAQAALEAGYADQSHLTREVRALAGVPPAELLGVRAARPPQSPAAG